MVDFLGEGVPPLTVRCELPGACLECIIVPLRLPPVLGLGCRGFSEGSSIALQSRHQCVELRECPRLLALEQRRYRFAGVFQNIGESRKRFLGLFACFDRVREMIGDQRHEALTLPAMQPNDCGEVGKLLGAEIENLARDLAVDAARIKHQHLVRVLYRFGLVQKPKLAGHRACVEEVASYRDHGVHIAALDQIATDSRFLAARAGSL